MGRRLVQSVRIVGAPTALLESEARCLQTLGCHGDLLYARHWSRAGRGQKLSRKDGGGLWRLGEAVAPTAEALSGSWKMSRKAQGSGRGPGGVPSPKDSGCTGVHELSKVTGSSLSSLFPPRSTPWLFLDILFEHHLSREIFPRSLTLSPPSAFFPSHQSALFFNITYQNLPFHTHLFA